MSQRVECVLQCAHAVVVYPTDDQTQKLQEKSQQAQGRLQLRSAWQGPDVVQPSYTRVVAVVPPQNQIQQHDAHSQLASGETVINKPNR